MAPKVPVLVRMGRQLEGPVLMSIEEGPALLHKRAQDMYAIRTPPTTVTYRGRPRLGYVVSREAAQTLAWDPARHAWVLAEGPNGAAEFAWAKPWLNSAQTVRAMNALGRAAAIGGFMIFALWSAGFGLGVIASKFMQFATGLFGGL